MNSKKAITLLVLVTLIMGLIPIVPVHAALTPAVALYDTTGAVVTSGDKGDTVSAQGTGVTAGKTVEIYWDAVQPWSSADREGLWSTRE